MQIKYLTLAMTAALALNLTACKDDKKSSGKTDTKPVASTPAASTPAASTPATSTPATSTPVVSGSIDGQNNVGDAATGGSLTKKFTAGNQHYTRNAKSKFDLQNNPNGTVTGIGERGSSFATNFLKLKNTDMANIVLARNSAAREKDRVTFYLGTTKGRTEADALQVYNYHAAVASSSTASVPLVANFVDGHVKAPLGTERGVITNDSSTSAATADSGLVYVGNQNIVTLASGATTWSADTTDEQYKLLQTRNFSGQLSSKYYDKKGKALATSDQPTSAAVTAMNSANAFSNVVGKEEQMTQSLSRIFGASYRPENPTDARNVTFTKNSYAYYDFSGRYRTQKIASGVTGIDGVQDLFRAETASAPAGFGTGLEELDLKHVQYGRVTTNLDAVESIKKTNSRVSKIGNEETLYYQIQVDDQTNGGDVQKFLTTTVNENNAVNNYFYRGVARSGDTSVDGKTTYKAIPTAGTAQYYGHAITYGLDNSYHGGVKTSGTDSNSLSQATSGNGVIEAVGNFVGLKVDWASKKVTGQVYNVWHKTDGSVVQDNLVNLDGEIVGKNNIKGEATRTYVANDDKADFKASFYGDAGAEMGGAFNSIKQTKDNKGTYGNVSWGGVFGAKNIAAGSSGFETEKR